MAIFTSKYAAAFRRISIAHLTKVVTHAVCEVRTAVAVASLQAFTVEHLAIFAYMVRSDLRYPYLFDFLHLGF